MPFETEVDDKKQLTIQTVTGEPSFEESMAAFKQFYDGKPTQKVLRDFRIFKASNISRYISFLKSLNITSASSRS